MRNLILIGALLMVAARLHAQGVEATGADARLPTFDVVSIKRSIAGPGSAMIISPIDSDRIIVANASPRLIIGEAWNIRLHDLIAGLPSWADSEAYDIEAKVAASDLPAFHKLLPMQRNPMLRSVLADRFHLVCHFETRTLPAYALVVAKGGAKLKEVQPGTLSNGLKNPGGADTTRNQITATGISAQALAHMLQMQLGRQVIDRTGLAGNYDFTLKFAPVQSAASPDSGTDDASSPPSIFTAVQEQLGLKLESVKAPVEVLVVDHIDHPSEN
jgi:uncharacterized protein (TIGR03435 family)